MRSREDGVVKITQLITRGVIKDDRRGHGSHVLNSGWAS